MCPAPNSAPLHAGTGHERRDAVHHGRGHHEVSRDGDFKLVSGYGGSYRARAVIIATGSSLRSAGIPGEEELRDRGVSHCATCDGPMSMGQTVGVVGGGDSAADEALTLTEYADKGYCCSTVGTNCGPSTFSRNGCRNIPRWKSTGTPR